MQLSNRLIIVTVEIPAKSIRQLSIEGFGIEPCVFPSERIKPGDDAISVLAEILKVNEGINRISYTTHSSLAVSDTEFGHDNLNWLAVSLVTRPNILQLQKDIKNSTIQYFPHGFNEAVYDFQCVAISSQIIVNGKKRHLLQLDFDGGCIVDTEQGLDEMTKELELPPGYLLRTDNSYHFWSINHYDFVEWSGRMNYTREKEAKRSSEGKSSFLDSNYLDVSNNRGYTALRVSGHGVAEYKLMDPIVIAVIR